MIQCPYCEETCEDWDKFNLHALKSHPDKTQLADFREAKVNRLWTTATELTRITFDGENHRKNNVLNTFRFFLRELMKSEGEKP